MKSDINGCLYFVNLFFIYATGSCIADMDRYAAFWMGFIHSLFREKTHGLQGRIKKIPQLLQLWDSEGVCSCFCLKLRQVCVSMAAFLLAFFCFRYFSFVRASAPCSLLDPCRPLLEKENPRFDGLSMFNFPFFGVFRQSNLSMFSQVQIEVNELFGDKLGVRLRMEGLVVSNFDVPEAGIGYLHEFHGLSCTSMSSMDYHHSPLMLWMAGDCEEVSHIFAGFSQEATFLQFASFVSYPLKLARGSRCRLALWGWDRCCEWKSSRFPGGRRC